jgi:predicted acetyltransferase
LATASGFACSISTGALTARSYAAEGSLAFELHDAFYPENEGVWRLEVSRSATTLDRDGSEPELRLGVGQLGSAYLGGITFAELHAAGAIEELKEDAVARADALFRTPLAPWCPEIF